MRAAFRKLGTLTAMPWGFFVNPFFFLVCLAAPQSAFASGSVYKVMGSDHLFFDSIESACNSSEAMSAFVSKHMSSSFTFISVSSKPPRNESQCYVQLRYRDNDPADYGGPEPIYIGSCQSKIGDSKTLQLPASRSTTSSLFAAAEPPSTYCFSGCSANRNSNAYGCTPSSEDGLSGTCSADYQFDGASCNSSSNPSLEPPVDDSGSGGDTGGGDTGGGDSGGESGGGDSGGGDSGGGDSGGGDSGGGDSGGGDTGGGDSGGGDTGGGDTGGGGTGTTGGATSADIRNLGDRITNAIAGHYNSLASSIAALGDRLTGKLDQLGDKVDQLNGPAFSEGDIPGEFGGIALGFDAGNDLAGQINAAVEQVVAEREAGLLDDLGSIDGMVSGWFGPGGKNIDSNDLLGSMFPAPSGCRDYVLPVYRDIVLTLPVCHLAAIKPLLEWVFAVLTAIAVWRILMNGLLAAAGRSLSGAR